MNVYSISVTWIGILFNTLLPTFNCLLHNYISNENDLFKLFIQLIPVILLSSDSKYVSCPIHILNKLFMLS